MLDDLDRLISEARAALEGHRREVERLQAYLERLEQARDALAGLPDAKQPVTVTDVEHLPSSRLRMAKRRDAGPLVQELHRRSIPLRELHRLLTAEGHRVSDAHLSRIFNAIHPCPDELREPIERLTSGAKDAEGNKLPGIRLP